MLTAQANFDKQLAKAGLDLHYYSTHNERSKLLGSCPRTASVGVSTAIPFATIPVLSPLETMLLLMRNLHYRGAIGQCVMRLPRAHGWVLLSSQTTATHMACLSAPSTGPPLPKVSQSAVLAAALAELPPDFFAG